MPVPQLDRRWLLIGSAANVAIITSPMATAQTTGSAREQLEVLEERAKRSGIPTPVGDAARTASRSLQELDSYSELLPRLVDLIDRADTARSTGLAEETADLLGRIHREERSLAPDVDEQRVARPAPTFENLKTEYRDLFTKCSIEPKSESKVQQHVETLKKYKPQYQSVAQTLSIPYWYFIGIIHALEAGFNFRTHLHNGDPLSRKTTQVPAGRPVPWDPPNDWESSADDALRIKHFDGQADWSLEQLLYRWELYNGFGYRSKRAPGGGPVNSPYLWSFSNQYQRGKYVRDGVWDPNAVSQQCGAASMLIGLIQAGEISTP